MYQFLYGFGTGMLLAVLFAPRSGGATRDYVRRQTDELRESALDMVDRGRDALHRQVEKLATPPPSVVEVYQR